MSIEEVMDILNKWEFFYGQRAGRELWADKSRKVQDEDIESFNRDVAKVKAAIEDLRLKGKWVYDIENDTWYCSVCGEENCYAYSKELKRFTDNYCPNCGAKMEG